jgi:thiamine biosynthesis lipoprotein
VINLVLKRGACFALSILALLLGLSCRVPEHRETRLAMSTTLTVLVSGPGQPDWEGLFDYADAKARQFDHRYEDSPVGDLNRGRQAALPVEVLEVIDRARKIATLSDGAFDPTILPLTELWSFDTGGRIPSQQEILAARRRVDHTRIEIAAGGEISLPPGFGLDLGAIAKGAVVDLLSLYLEEQGHKSYLIDAGGDILVSGLKGKSTSWRIAIRHPRDSQAVIGVISLGGEAKRIAVVTSGDYERFFEQGGRRYHHILDPRSGYPASEVISVTVIAPTCAAADALATAAFVLGPDRGLQLLEDLPDTEGLVIEEGNGALQARATSGFPLPVESLQL